jgi:hypothetical protein
LKSSAIVVLLLPSPVAGVVKRLSANVGGMSIIMQPFRIRKIIVDRGALSMVAIRRIGDFKSWKVQDRILTPALFARFLAYLLEIQ